jgi:hypothetical protein
MPYTLIRMYTHTHTHTPLQELSDTCATKLPAFSRGPHVPTMYIYQYVRTCVCLRVYACVCVCVCLSVCLCFVYMHTYNIYVYIIYVYTNIRIHTHTHTHTHTHAHMNKCLDADHHAVCRRTWHRRQMRLKRDLIHSQKRPTVNIRNWHQEANGSQKRPNTQPKETQYQYTYLAPTGKSESCIEISFPPLRAGGDLMSVLCFPSTF